MATYTDNYNLTKPTFAESADIRTINGNMDTIDAVMHASQVSLADAYDETRTSSNPYNTGDIVMYELLMYKCLEDGVYGTWDGTKWERTTAGANGGGSDVTITPSYNSGTKIAEIDVDGDTEEIYVPEMTGASSQADGTAGLPPAPEAGDEDKFFRGDGTWAEVGGGADYVELTQAEYDALTPAEKMNGKMYFITDGNADTASDGEPTSEIIPITAGDGTTSRTFTFDKTPQFIKFYWQDTTLDGGWATDGDMLWGQPYMNYRSKRMGATVANVDGGISTIAYGADNKSITITGGNAFGAMNSINGSGYMFIDYGGSGGSGGSSEKTLIYTLQQGMRWETFNNPNSEHPLIIEACGGGGVIASVKVDASKLPSRDGGDNYVTICTLPNAQGQKVNMATTNSGATINISTDNTYDTNLYYVKIYAVS